MKNNEALRNFYEDYCEKVDMTLDELYSKSRKRELVEHYSAIPVCRQCHTTYHNLGMKEFQFKFDINVYELAHYYLSKHLHIENI